MQDKPFRLEDAQIEANELLNKMKKSSESLDNIASLIINRVDDDDEKIRKYKERQKTIEAFFRKRFKIILALVVPLIIEICIIVFPGMIAFPADNSSNTSTSSSLVHNSLMSEKLFLFFLFNLFILIVSLTLFFHAYKKEICTTNSSGLNVETDNIDNGEIDSLNLTSSPQLSGNVRTYFDNSKEILLSIVSSVGESVPVINSLYKNTTRLVNYRQLLEKYQQSLKYYNLINDDSLFEKIGEFVPARNIMVESEGDWEKTITSRIRLYCIQEKIEVSDNILLLLYNEHNGKQCTDTFRDVGDSEKEVKELADVLIKSKRLITPPNNYEYKNEDIIAIIRKIYSLAYQILTVD